MHSNSLTHTMISTDTVSIKPKVTQTPTTSPIDPLPLDLGRDALRTLMQESGMNPIDPITREQLKNSTATYSCAVDMEELGLDQGYEAYDITGNDDDDDDELEMFEIDDEINEALRELGI
ncbi:hypothetical protein HDU79_003372 [Rhizoclosmatium sp. JEL0117]|nr:hypothetical protein HDU79_003372 [Rhizoclosmatium sp. JEL0117]